MIAGLIFRLAVPFSDLVNLYDYHPNTRLELKTGWPSDHDGIGIRIPGLLASARDWANQLPHFLEVVDPVEALHYVPHLAPVSAIFQSARFDPGLPAGDAQAFYDTATQPKQIRWYDTGHDIADIAAISDRARFLGRLLKLPGMDAVIRTKAGKN